MSYKFYEVFAVCSSLIKGNNVSKSPDIDFNCLKKDTIKCCDAKFASNNFNTISTADLYGFTILFCVFLKANKHQISTDLSSV